MPLDLTEYAGGQPGAAAPPPGGPPPLPPDAGATSAVPPVRGQDLPWPQASPLIQQYESGGRNIPNFAFKAHGTPGDPARTAFGPWQITDENWREYAPQVGIDLKRYPTTRSTVSAGDDQSRRLQERVARRLYEEKGWAPWVPFNPQLAAAVGGEVVAPSRRLGRMPAMPGGLDLGAYFEAQPKPPTLGERVKAMGAKVGAAAETAAERIGEEAGKAVLGAKAARDRMLEATGKAAPVVQAAVDKAAKATVEATDKVIEKGTLAGEGHPLSDFVAGMLQARVPNPVRVFVDTANQTVNPLKAAADAFREASDRAKEAVDDPKHEWGEGNPLRALAVVTDGLRIVIDPLVTGALYTGGGLLNPFWQAVKQPTASAIGQGLDRLGETLGRFDVKQLSEEEIRADPGKLTTLRGWGLTRDQIKADIKSVKELVDVGLDVYGGMVGGPEIAALKMAPEVEAFAKAAGRATEAERRQKAYQAAAMAQREGAMTRQALRNIRIAVSPPKLAPDPDVGPVRLLAMGLDHSMGFQKAHAEIEPYLRNLTHGTVMPLGDLMDKILPHTSGYAKAFTEKMLKHIDRNTTVEIFNNGNDIPGQGPNVAGDHDIVRNHIRLRVDSFYGDGAVNNVMHEAIHSITISVIDKLVGEELDAARLAKGSELSNSEIMAIVNNPKSDMIKELDMIIAEAKARVLKSGRSLEARAFYGIRGAKGPRIQAGATQPNIWDVAHHAMSPRYEFLAEVFTRTDFQEFLANSEKYASPKYKFRNLMRQMTTWIGQHLGITDPKELGLLDAALRSGTRMMETQTAMGGQKAIVTPARRWIGDYAWAAAKRNQPTIVARDAEGAITAGDIRNATTQILPPVERPPEPIRQVLPVGAAPRLPPEVGRAIKAAETDTRISIERWLRSLAPEMLSRNAKLGAAVIAKALTRYEQAVAAVTYGSRTRLRFWASRKDQAMDFIDRYEKGGPAAFHDNPVLRDLAEHYKRWAERLAKKDIGNGLQYEPRDHYLYHVFLDQEGVADYFNKKYGSKWLDPDFVKDRVFDLYKEARDAGFTPKYDNPEDIMLARDYASSMAEERINILDELASHGLAIRKMPKEEERIIVGAHPVTGEIGVHIFPEKPATEKPPNTETVRSPTGDIFFVDKDVHLVLHNAMFSKGLWELEGLEGRAFRGFMSLKNAVVPYRLAFSLFHPLHIAGIDMAAGMTRATADMLAGKIHPVTWLAKSLESGFNPIMETINIPFGRGGWRVVRAFEGKIPEELLTEDERLALKTVFEMGITPKMSSIHRSNARANFMQAMTDLIVDAKRGRPVRTVWDASRATWHLPFATMSALAHPIFEVWIPSLKTASALKDAASWIARNPELAANDSQRLLHMRRLGKSVENRYGEMAYNKLFWQKWIKDVAVADTLSLGWQLGFLREYGGGAMQLGKLATHFPQGLQMAKKGELDKLLFVSHYTILGAGLGGLMTWAMTGKPPEGLMDYVNPRTGKTNPDGTPQRVTTMFYSREFAALYKHMENEGLAAGVSREILNKGSGILSLIHESWTGINEFGQHVRDEDADFMTQVEQQVAYSLAQLEPISMRAVDWHWRTNSLSELPGKMAEGATPLSVLGFAPEPKYMQETKTTAGIKDTYRRFVAGRETPYEAAERSEQYAKLRDAYRKGSGEWPKILNQMSVDHKLTGKQQAHLIRSLNENLTPEMRMFISLGRWPEKQQALLDKMSPAERRMYLPHAAKTIRWTYRPPERRPKQP
jgi:hypothetical protein